MSLLREYLNVLTDAEKERLSKALFTTREKEVLNLVECFDEEKCKQERKRRAISAANWDKLQSVVLRKCYLVFVPNGGAVLLHHLSARYALSKHVQKEYSHQQKYFVPTLGKKEKQQYYSALLDNFLSRPLFDTSQTFLHGLLRKLLENVSLRERAIQNIIWTSKIHSSRISHLSSTMQLQQTRTDAKLEQLLLKEYTTAAKTTSKEAQLFADLALYDYYAAIESHAQLLHIKRAKILSDSIAEFDTLTKQQIHTKYATTLYLISNDFANALDEYKAIFKEYPTAKNNIYPVAKYIQLCLILSRTAEAKEILDITFQPLLQHSKHNVAANAALNYAKYYVLTQEYTNAITMINKGLGLLKRKLYVQYEIEFRNLQTAVLLLIGDSDAAMQSIERNLKYLRSKGFKSSNSDFHEYYTLLRDCITQGSLFTPTKEHEAILTKWQTGAYNIYGVLLQKIVSSAIAK